MMVLAVVFLSGLQAKALVAQKEVRIMWLCDPTGPYSALHTLNVKGLEDFFKWSNETDYIKGIKLIVDTYDTGMDVGKAVAAFNMGLAKDPRPVMTTGGMATPTCLVIKPLSKKGEDSLH